MRKTILFLFVAVMTVSIVGIAAEPQSITTKINNSGTITVKHDNKLEQRIKPKVDPVDPAAPVVETDKTSTQKERGFRVLVFTDDNKKTARNEANEIAKIVAGKFPQYRVYVTFNSPNWRVKVGDFTTKEEVVEVATEIKNALPDVGNGVKILRDNINVK